MRFGFDGGVDARIVKWNAELRSEIVAKGKILVGFCSAQSVMQMRGMEHEAQFPAPLVKHAKQGNGVRASGKTDGEAHAGLEKRGVERESGQGFAHERNDSFVAAIALCVRTSILNPC